MKKLFLTMMLVLIPVQAQALIPDVVGCAYSDGGWYADYVNYCGTSFFGGSNIAHEFNLYETLNISSIETMMMWNGDDRYLDQIVIGANMVLYEGSIEDEHHGRTPSGNRIFEQSFTIDKDLDDIYSFLWRGVSNVSLVLDPGNYWLGVEDGTPSLFASGGPRFGLEQNVVPEPSTIFLFGTGLIGAFIRRRRRS